MIKTISLDKLVVSPRNVRRSGDPKADAELKADIEAHGLLQNLVVTAVKKPRGCFAVEAGERRRRALQALADDGKLAGDAGVCCFVVDRADAPEASLAENFQRLAMNPADECLAFQQLIEQGLDVPAIARRFGLTERSVEGRLRLAGLAPVVFEALGAGTISLDIAKAYAATPDQERQAFVFEQAANSYMGNHPDSIRRLMTQATVASSDRSARFIGEDAYVAAGGRIEQDLFAEEGEARWLDVALVERLAAEKLDQAAAQIQAEQGLAFVRPTLDHWVSFASTEGLRRVALEGPPLTAEESAEVEQLEGEIGELVSKLEDEETSNEDRAAAETKLSELDRAIDAIVSKPPVVPDELAGKVGAFLLLDAEGQPKLDLNLYAECDASDCGAEVEPADTADAPDAAPRRAGLSRRLVDELAIQRRDILAVGVAADPAFALDLAIFLMADREGHYSGGKSGSSLSAFRPPDPVAGFTAPAAEATRAAAEANSKLDRSWLAGGDRPERFDAFRALGEEARLAWLGELVARTLEASANLPGERSCAFHDHLGQLLGIDVASWWRPTGANYFDRAPKVMALAALAEVGGQALADAHSKSKKAELAQACERIFAGNMIAEADVKQAALSWVPEAMRFASPEAGEAPRLEPHEAEPAANGDEPAPWEEQPAIVQAA